ncbi:invasion associated locus b family protein [Methylobacterium sp. J-076]|uniref:invasion associated locus b family protein n=1 Tax=Methylobacterium sp. J-076 TaxID=2836655 RepID=UPI001FB8F3B4|nr:invasion associated locus b family protein [Methylobacterium sp. J-076]MCJ2014556.1 invasion associated locus b family protein [Methylobacterium sp. J-076]
MVRVSHLVPVGIIALLACAAPPDPMAGRLFGAGAAQAQDAEAPADTAPSRRSRHAARRSSRKSERSAMSPPGMQQAVPVAIFGGWNVFVNGDGPTRICYAIAQPQSRSPKTLKRDSAYLFVTVRKAENVANEVAVMLGFPPKPAAAQIKAGTPAAPTDPSLSLGASRYGLVVKDGNAWLQNPTEESRVVTEMSGRSPKLTIKTTSLRGNPTSDEYELAGFADAIKRARDECAR